MACKFRSCFLRILGNSWRLSINKNGCFRLKHEKGFCSTCCLGKSSPNKSTDSDLDFFGVEELETNTPDHRSISSDERRWLNSLVERHNEPKQKRKQTKTKFGYIFSDNSLKDDRSELLAALTLSESEKEALKTEATFTSESAGVVENKKTLMFPSAMTENFSRQQINNEVLSEYETPDSEIEMSVIDDQYFSYISDQEKKVEPSHSSEPKRSGHSVSFIDEQYFDYGVDNQKTHRHRAADNFDSQMPDENTEMSFIDEQFIGHNTPSLDRPKIKSVKNKLHEDDSSFIDQQYFTNSEENISSNHLNIKRDSYQLETIKSVHHTETKSESLSRGVRRPMYEQPKIYKPEVNSSESQFMNNDPLEFNETDLRIQQTNKPVDEILDNSHETDKKSGDANSQSAFDLALKIRKQYESKSRTNLTGKFDPKEYDSLGFKILKNQVPHLQHAPSIDVVNVLRKSVIYNDNDIVAITKPYNLPSHGGPGVLHSVESLADRILPKQTLIPVHQIGKETTGVLLLAKSEETCYRLSEFISSGKAIQRYLAISKNIPELKTGEIDIPIAEGKVGDRMRMCLRPHKSPELSQVYRSRTRGNEAITRYRVLDEGQKCSLLECMPLTYRKHQIRVHLAFGLNCPILGDHKYAHTNKIAPMNLHPEMLERLKVQQSKVRYVPMHLHYRSVVFPEYLDGKNLYISAPLPPHFLRNLQDLKMKLPRRS